MAKQIFLEVDTTQAADALGRVNKTIAELRQQNAEMKKELKQGGGDWAEYSKKIAENEKAIKLLTGDQKALTGQLQTEQGVLTQTTGSYEELNASLNQMIREYKSLSAAQRESAQGKELLKSISETDSKLKQLDADMGSFHRNVGNYPSALAPLEGILSKLGLTANDLSKGGLKALQGGIANTGKSFVAFGKTLLTTPLGWLLAAVTAVVAILAKLRDAIKKNDDAGTAFARLFASFDPILKMLNKGFERVAEALGKVAGWLADVIAKFSDEVAAAQEVVTATDNLEEKEREYKEQTAKNEAEISRLKVQAAEKEKYTTKERIGFMEQAIEKEKDNLRMTKELAEERLRLLQEEADRTADTSDEMKNKLADARIAVTNADKEYNDGIRRLSASLSSFRKDEADDAKAAADAVQQANERKLESDREYVRTAREISRMAEDLAVSMVKDESERRMRILGVRHKREIEDLKERLATDKTLTQESRAELEKYIIDREKQQAEEREQLADELAEERIQKEIERIQTYGEETAKAREENNAAELEQLQERLDAELQILVENEELTAEEKVRIRTELDARLAELADARMELEEQEAQKVKDEQAKIRSYYMASAQSAGAVFGEISDILKEFGKNNKEVSKASKAFAIMQIAISEAMNIANTAKAISSAVAGATEAAASTGVAAPFTAPLFIAEMTAAVLGGVAGTAASIKQALSLVNKYETGGIVGGTSYTGDNVTARVNSGEMILNREQQARLFDIANGGQAMNYEAMTTAMIAAVSAMPAPVLQYTEFESFTEDVRAVRMASEY